MSDAVVCLGCGRVVGAGQGWGCRCPPPASASLPSSSPRGPYRAAVAGAVCPRCRGQLAERELHDVAVLDCPGCLGLFLDRGIIERLGAPEGRDLRLAFPVRPRGDADRSVRYLHCPVCQGVMNRVNFGRVSGVVVDVCKPHGVWFDAGEVNAVIDFVERGGLERARQREAEERAAEKARLAALRSREVSALAEAVESRSAWRAGAGDGAWLLRALIRTLAGLLKG